MPRGGSWPMYSRGYWTEYTITNAQVLIGFFVADAINFTAVSDAMATLPCTLLDSIRTIPNELFFGGFIKQFLFFYSWVTRWNYSFSSWLGVARFDTMWRPALQQPALMGGWISRVPRNSSGILTASQVVGQSVRLGHQMRTDWTKPGCVQSLRPMLHTDKRLKSMLLLFFQYQNKAN